jgi:hypothetical protein
MSDEGIRVLFLAAGPFRERARRELEDAVHAVGHAIRRRVPLSNSVPLYPSSFP